jgi:predicted acyltransferase (DUF342 family)
MSTEDIEVRLQIVEGNVATLISNRNAAFSTFNALSLTYGLNVGTGSTDFDTYALSVGRDAFFAENVYIDGSIDLSSNLDISGSLRIGTDLFVLGGGSISGILDVSNDITGNSNLIIGENATISGNTFLNGDVSLGNDLLVLGNSVVEKDQTIQGTLNVNENLFLNGNLEISGELFAFSDIKLYTLNVETFANISGDVFMGSHLHVVGDVSMESSLEISQNLMVHGKTTLNDDVSLGAHLQVMGDVSFESSLDINQHLHVYGKTYLENDVSLGAHLQVTGDVSMEKDLDVSENVNIGNALHVMGDVSMESSVGIQENLHVHQDVVIDNDVSIGSHLTVFGDVSFQSSVEIYKNLIVHDLSIFKENVLIGTTTESLSDTSFNVYASSNGGDGFVYDGDVVIGIPNSTHDEVVANNRQLTLYGDLRIMDGGNLVIEDISNTTITQLETEVKVTDILNVTNDGTGSALTVNQEDTLYHDIVKFQDNSVNVFTIGKDGETNIYGSSQLHSTLNVLDNLRVDASNVDISQNLNVEKESNFAGNAHFQHNMTISGDLLLDGKLFTNDSINCNNDLLIVGDVSMQSSLEISENILVHGSATIHNDAMIHSSLHVNGDVSFDSSFDVSGAFIVRNHVTMMDDVSLGSQLDVVGDVSMGADLHVIGNISTDALLNVAQNMNVQGKTFLTDDVSLGSQLFIVGDVSMESSLLVNQELTVQGKSTLLDDVSLGSQLYVEGDVSMQSSLDVKESLQIQQHSTLVGDVHMGSRVDMVGDVSMESSLQVNKELTVQEHVLLGGDVSMGADLHVIGNISTDASLNVAQNFIVQGNTYLVNDVSMQSNVDVCGNLYTSLLNVGGKTFLEGDVSLGSHLYVEGDVSMESSLFIQKDLNVQENVHIYGDVSMESQLYVAGEVSIASILDVSSITIQNNAHIDKDISVNESAFIGSNLQVYGNATIGQYLNTPFIGIQKSDPEYSIHIEASDAILLPRGTSAERPTNAIPGLIRYNTETLEFEGYADSSWSIIGDGGVADSDQDTRIEAEKNSDDDTLRFYTNGNEVMTIDPFGDVSMTGKVHIESDVSLASSLDVSANLTVQKEAIFNDNLTVYGDVVTYNSLETTMIGIQTSDPSYSIHIEASDALLLPVGTTDERPSTVRDGLIRYNSTNNYFEGYSQDNWYELVLSQPETETISDTSVNDIDVSGTLHANGNITSSSFVGVGTTDPSYSLHISNNDAILIPVGSTNNRPSDVTPGLLRYNSDLQVFEGYYDNEWKEIGSENVEISGVDTSLIESTIQELVSDGDLSLNNVTISGTFECNSDVTMNTNLTVNSALGIGTTTPSVALDISSNDSIKIPVGTTSERPNLDEVGQVRYNTTSSLYEVYTNQTVWSGLPTHKTDQPPFLLNISDIESSESVTVQWEKFNEIYKDVFDGKSYPIYLQTIVDISFTDIDGTSSSGWNTLYIGNGNYNTSGISTTPLTQLTFDSINGNTYTNTTSYDIDFEDKPNTISLPTFTQNDTFDLRIYGVNRSESLPNYIYLYGVQLKLTGEPGPVTIVETTDFSKTQMSVDLSFNLDKDDPTITSGISIVHYDISFALTDTKSYETITHVDNFTIDWENNTSLSKNDIVITGLYPGAQYDIQVRAQNALNVDENGDYTYGDYGDVFTSSGFTNNSGNTDGLSTTQYIDTSDLNDVDPTGMTFTLENASSIQCHVAGTSSRANRTILNTSGYISIDGSSTFYVNYGTQGINLDNKEDLVSATVYSTINGSTIINDSVTYDATAIQDNVDVANSASPALYYTFSSFSSYTDEGTTSNYNQGFVYSSGITRTDTRDDLTTFNENFPSSTDAYEMTYAISSGTSNNTAQLNQSGDTSVTHTTGVFYVDDYSGTPSVSFSTVPTIQVLSSSTLFGIPSVTAMQLDVEFTVSSFASYIIPHTSGNHSITNTITSSNGTYSFSSFAESDVFETSDYTVSKTLSDSSITNQRFDSNTNHDFIVTIYYLDHSLSSPSIASYQMTQTISDIGYIFKDSVISYSGSDLYTFDGTSAIGSSSLTPSSHVLDDSTLLYFNGRFVSGGYSASYSSQTISAFSDWSTGYAVSGQDYSNFTNTGSSGFKWIAIDVTSYKSGNSVILTNFLIDGSSPATDDFGTTYEAYIYQNGKFGSLASAINVSATLWFNSGSNSTITLAKAGEGALQTNGVDAYIDSTSSEDIFLIVGLKQDSNNYFTFS